MFTINGKIALITGASHGIGRLLAEKLAADGATIVLVSRQSSKLETVRAELTAKGYSRIHIYACDVSIQQEVEELQRKVKKEVGIVTILVNSAGVVFKGYFKDQSIADIQYTLSTNLLGPITCTKCFLPDMIQQDEGYIINMSSASGLVGVAGLAIYASTKWGLLGFSESLYAEFFKLNQNIHITVACPSYIDTGMFSGVHPPLLTSVLKPEKIANLIYKAFKKNQLRVIEPFLLKWVPTFKGLLPPKAFQFVLRILNVQTGMDSFKGYEQND